MKLGVVFPQAEIGPDPGAIRDLAQAAETIGYDHMLIYERQLGIDPAAHPEFRSPHGASAPFHEPLVLAAYLAAVSDRLAFATNVLVLPQRSAVLTAKQVAELVLLSGGRFRLGVGVGDYRPPFTMLGADFGARGAFCEEQVRLMRELWSQELVGFEGRWHRIDGAGISPRPPEPAPVWFGGESDRVLRRIARMGDGWFPLGRARDVMPRLATLRGYVAEAGRAPDSVGVEPMVGWGDGRSLDAVAAEAREWRAAGVTHLSVNTIGCGFAGARQHVEAWDRAFGVLRPLAG